MLFVNDILFASVKSKVHRGETVFLSAFVLSACFLMVIFIGLISQVTVF